MCPRVQFPLDTPEAQAALQVAQDPSIWSRAACAMRGTVITHIDRTAAKEQLAVRLGPGEAWRVNMIVDAMQIAGLTAAREREAERANSTKQ